MKKKKKKKWVPPKVEFVDLVLEEVVLVACKSMAVNGSGSPTNCFAAACPSAGS